MVVQPVGAFSLVISILLGVYHREPQPSIGRSSSTVAVCVVGVDRVRDGLRAGRDDLSHEPGRRRTCWPLLALVSPRSRASIVIVTVSPSAAAAPHHGRRDPLRVRRDEHARRELPHRRRRVSLEGLSSLPWINVVALAASGLVGSWFVQSSYSAGPPGDGDRRAHRHRPDRRGPAGCDCSSARRRTAVSPPILGMSAFGATACASVVLLSKHHPDAVAAEVRRSHQKYGPALGAGDSKRCPILLADSAAHRHRRGDLPAGDQRRRRLRQPPRHRTGRERPRGARRRAVRLRDPQPRVGGGRARPPHRLPPLAAASHVDDLHAVGGEARLSLSSWMTFVPMSSTRRRISSSAGSRSRTPGGAASPSSRRTTSCRTTFAPMSAHPGACSTPLPARLEGSAQPFPAR